MNELTEILFITSYPTRVCGIASYSADLIMAMKKVFNNSLTIKVCALESDNNTFEYPDEVKYRLDTSQADRYEDIALKINDDQGVKFVLIQHEFGFFNEQEEAFHQFLGAITKPIVLVFHTVLPNPDESMKVRITDIIAHCSHIIVMTQTSARILAESYGVGLEKISVIAHGTHLVPHLNENFLKSKYGLQGRKVLTTFGLLSAGKSIETTLEALPSIVRATPEVLFLVIGKTHPEVVKREGEKYRESLLQKVEQYGLDNHVKFINNYLPLPELLEYLQLTDIYLFTTNDPNQAVSGTFVYAASCACPIISTPIPHAKEVLTSDTGIIFDFRNSGQLAESVIRLLNDNALRRHISSNTLQKIVSTAWENSAIAHVKLLERVGEGNLAAKYNMPPINLDHIKRMTTAFGIIQFSKINQRDISSGYTLDDNARALVAMCMYLQFSGDKDAVKDIKKYLGFIKFCQQPDGSFLNYVDKDRMFTAQNDAVNLDDSNGRAIWALGYLVSLSHLLPVKIRTEAKKILDKSLLIIEKVHSPRAMAFAIKGIYYYQSTVSHLENLRLLKILADRLVQMYRHESNPAWGWFEGYMTYANSILPESMLYAWLVTGNETYRNIALSSLAFLLSQTFNENGIEVISNRSWLQKGETAGQFGEQPIDVAYTIMTLSKFYDSFKTEEYYEAMETAFNWFLGNNRLHQIIYNPCTGGCYDGLEETHVNLNQGAESTVSYLLARLTMEKYVPENRI